MVECLLDAFGGVPEEYVQAAARAMGYLPEKHKKPVVRNLLIAAVLTGLLAASAMGASLYGRAQQLAQMPPSPEGQQRVALIPNGVKGNPTFQGSAEWWAFMAQWEDSHDPADVNFDLEFTKGDLDQYNTCNLYGAYDPEQADKLYEIAEKYDLKLYTEKLHFDDYGGKQFFDLTGCEPFAEGMEGSRIGGYVFDDGSFRLETEISLEEKAFVIDITRIRSGSIYPYGGAGMDPLQHQETVYVNSHGQQLTMDIPANAPYDWLGSLTYVSPDGQTWLEVNLYHFKSSIENPEQTAQALADALDFEALSVRNTAAKEILDIPTGAEDNRSTAQKLEAFRSSPAVSAALEFGDFFHENFYGNSFSGTYGMDGFADIDEKLTELSRKYGLSYARSKNKGNSFYENAAVYDNGSWNGSFYIEKWNSSVTVHYIPKDALYTAWVPPLPISEYRRVWEYKTRKGLTLLCYSDGPSVLHGSGAVLETENAYLFMPFGGTVPQDLQFAADMVDWAEIIKEGEK